MAPGFPPAAARPQGARQSTPPGVRSATVRRERAAQTTLVGGVGSLASGNTPVKTVGGYWPYATTLFDYVRRAMPFPETKSLTNDEIYAVSAYILNLNGIVATNDVLDAQSLPKVKMPNRGGFIPFPRDPK